MARTGNGDIYEQQTHIPLIKKACRAAVSVVGGVADGFTDDL